jgi:hypothetical protein
MPGQLLQPLFLLTVVWFVGHQLLLPALVSTHWPCDEPPLHPPGVAQQVEPVQSVQRKPKTPHALVALPGWQVPPTNAVQQPVGQLFPLQTHWPLTQAWPATHCALLPHMQVPFWQLSERLVTQEVQVTPWAPHSLFAGIAQRLLRQQLFGHESALHTHWPFTHCWPPMHGGPLPHWQAPLVQLSVMNVLHATHARPLVPQVRTERVWHWLFWQQPVGHDAASHKHWPFTHCWPATHCGPVPQEQSPWFAQPSAMNVLQA